MSQMGQKREFLFSGNISASDSCGHWPEGTVARLRDNRFAVWVIGDVRDDLGCYINLPGRPVAVFEAAGA
jgi:hypothetical protein